MPIFKAFGLNFKSPFDIPEIKTSESNVYDVEIVFGKKLHLIDTQNKITNKYFEKNEKEVILTIEDVGKFYMKNGKRIEVFPETPSFDIKTIRLFLLGSCIGILLQQRGILSLHASGIVVRNKVTLFTGQSGVGKSTTISHFIKKGFPLTGDDVQPIIWSNNIPHIIPSAPNVKLWKDALEEFDEQLISQNSRVRPEFEKYRVAVHHQFQENELPINQCVVLDWSDNKEIQIEKLSFEKAFKHYQKNIYRKGFCQLPEEKVRLIGYAQRLAKQVPLFKVYRNKKIHSANIFHQFLFNTLFV